MLNKFLWKGNFSSDRQKRKRRRNLRGASVASGGCGDNGWFYVDLAIKSGAGRILLPGLRRCEVPWGIEGFGVRQLSRWARLSGDPGVVTPASAFGTILHGQGRAHFANPAKDAVRFWQHLPIPTIRIVPYPEGPDVIHRGGASGRHPQIQCPNQSGEARRRQQPAVVSSAPSMRQESTPLKCQTPRQMAGRLCHPPCFHRLRRRTRTSIHRGYNEACKPPVGPLRATALEVLSNENDIW